MSLVTHWLSISGFLPYLWIYTDFFHLLTCSFKPILFKGELYKLPLLYGPSLHPSFSIQVPVFTGLWGEVHISTDWVSYSKHLLYICFHFIIVIQMSCGEISRWMPPARTLLCCFAIKYLERVSMPIVSVSHFLLTLSATTVGFSLLFSPNSSS